MSFKLRGYQQEACHLGLEFLKSNTKKRGIIVAPTASGKSLLIAHMTREIVNMGTGDGVLVLQPSKELIEQNFHKFLSYGGIASLYSDSVKSRDVGQVTYATIGTIVNKAKLFAHVKYVLIDECHKVPPPPKKTKKKGKAQKDPSMYMRFLSELSELRGSIMVCGLTATPFRPKTYRNPFDKTDVWTQMNLLPRERPMFFNHFIHVTQIKELYNQGFLAPLKYFVTKFDGSYLDYNSTGAEFSDASMLKAMEKNEVLLNVPKVINEATSKGRKHILVFVRRVEDAVMLSSKVPDSGYICAETKPDEREHMLLMFKEGIIKTLFNVSVFTTGFDFPPLDTIVLARPTNSLILYMQMIGRVMRPHESKEYGAVVDLCGNVARFGAVEDMLIEYDNHLGWAMHNGKGKLLTGTRIDK